MSAINAGVAQKCACRRPRAGCVYAASVRRSCAVCVWLIIWTHVRRNSSREQHHDAERIPMHPRPPRHRPGVAMRSRRGVVLGLSHCCRAHACAAVCVRGPLGDPAGACALRRHPERGIARGEASEPARAHQRGLQRAKAMCPSASAPARRSCLAYQRAAPGARCPARIFPRHTTLEQQWADHEPLPKLFRG